MKLNLTTISKTAVYFIGLSIFTICAILLPELAREEAVGKPDHPSALPFLIAAWVLSIPIFIALHQALKLIMFIDQNKVFSDQTVKTIQNIKISSIVFILMVILADSIIITIGRNTGEDIPPFITLGFIIVFVTSVITTFTAVLQRLLEDAIVLKTENELTI